MADSEIYQIDPAHQPDPENCAFDIGSALSSIVSLQTKVPENAYTIQALGAERAGHGVVINDTGLEVPLILDEWMMDQPRINFHPLLNTMTVGLSPADLIRFLENLGHSYHIKNLNPLKN